MTMRDNPCRNTVAGGSGRAAANSLAMGLDRDTGRDEYFADYERRAAERRQRRRARARRRPVPRGELGWLVASPAGRTLVGLVAAIAALTVLGLAVLWPRGGAEVPAQPLPRTLPAHVADVRETDCNTPTPQRCREISIRVGRDRSKLDLGPITAAPEVSTGDAVRVTAVPRVEGVPQPPDGPRYSFVDVERRRSIVIILAVVAMLALILLRWRGLLATLGVLLSLLLLLKFIVPALLAGRPAILVALTGSLAVMFVTVTLTNGLGAQTMAAALGITATLLLACGLAAAGVHLASLDGRGDDLALALGQQTQTVSLTGVVLAGMIVGALGVLADTAVTQASAVMALRRADPTLSGAALYRAALVVGRDHLSATIHTLVLAYAGALLPLLLIVTHLQMTTVDALNMQSIAEPAVATAVGCAALIAAVPFTTGLAAAIVARIPASQIPHHSHTH
jgi:uncharacterized membrane protein